MAIVVKQNQHSFSPKRENMVWVVWAFVGCHYNQIFKNLPMGMVDYRDFCNVDMVRKLSFCRLEKLYHLISQDKALTKTGEFTEETNGLLWPLIRCCHMAARE